MAGSTSAGIAGAETYEEAAGQGLIAGINAALAEKGVQHDFLELNAALATLVKWPAAFDEWLAGQRVFAPAAPG